MIKNFDSYNFTNFINSLGINFSDFNLYPEQFTHKSDIHGINHTFRVMFNVLMIGSQIGDKLNTKRAFMAAYIHDMGRTNDGNCKVHGALAAKTKLPKYIELFIKNGMNEDDLKAIKVAVVNHCEKYELDKEHPYYKTVSILRDADGLDLVRLDYEVKPHLLRNPESIKLMEIAEDLFSKTEFNHYSRFVDFLKDAMGDYKIKENKENDLIKSIIDRNIEKSKEFGLIIKPEDIEKEKGVILSVFSKQDLKNLSKLTNYQYNEMYNSVLNDVMNQMEDELKYYFYNSTSGVRNKYNCHLINIVQEIMLSLSNNLYEIVKWYKGGKLIPDPEHPASKIIEYDDVITDDEFRDFLISHGAYEEFIKYCHRDREGFRRLYKNGNGRSMIDNCLTWSGTSSGSGYWSRLNDEWNEIMDEKDED